MSEQSKETPYIYQPFGMQHADHWSQGRIYAIAADSPLMRIEGLTKDEAEKLLPIVRSCSFVSRARKALASINR